MVDKGLGVQSPRLEFKPLTHIKVRGAVHVCNPNAGVWRPQSSPASLPRSRNETQPHCENLFQTYMWTVTARTPDVYPRASHACTCVHTHGNMHTYTTH